jgi:hypothetical protein
MDWRTASYGDAGGSSKVSVAEGQAKVIEYLKTMPRHIKITAQQVMQATNVDIYDGKDQVVEALRRNTHVTVTGDQGASGETFAYKPKLDVVNRNALEKLIFKSEFGISESDLADCYPEVKADTTDLINCAKIIAIKNNETKDMTFFPRGEIFLAELSLKEEVRLEPREMEVIIEGGVLIGADIPSEVRRGDALQIGVPESVGDVSAPARTFRLSSLNSKTESKDQSITPGSSELTSSSNKPLPGDGRAKYVHDFSNDSIPFHKVDTTGNGFPSLKGTLYKHGCTNDIRHLWKKTLIDWPEDRIALQRAMLKAKLGRYTATLVHSYTPTLLHSCTPALLHSYTPTLLHPYTPSPSSVSYTPYTHIPTHNTLIHHTLILSYTIHAHTIRVYTVRPYTIHHTPHTTYSHVGRNSGTHTTSE